MKVGFIGAGRMGRPMLAPLVRARPHGPGPGPDPGKTPRSRAVGYRLGVSEPTLLGALRHRSAASRALDLVARHGSATAFTAARGEFIGKDVAVVRDTVERLGSDLEVLDDVLDVAGRV